MLNMIVRPLIWTFLATSLFIAASFIVFHADKGEDTANRIDMMVTNSVKK